MTILPISHQQIKKFMQTKEGRVELLENCEIIFDETDEVNKDILNNDGLSFADYDRITKKLSGCIMFLKPVATMAEAYRHNVRHEKLVEFKLQGDKTTGVILTSKSQVAVKSYYNLVTIIDGYISRCYCGIKECERQSINKKYEFKNTGVGEDEN